MAEDEKRVVQFRPKPVEQSVPQSKDAPREASSHTQNRAEAHRQRQIANLAAALFAVLLTAVGVWLASSLNRMRQVQDCVAMGMRDCSAVSGNTPHS